MGRIEKTVFISYRRTNFYTALAVYQDLTAHGYDVFFDYQSIDSGEFEKIILDNIKARAHFIVILTPSALDRCRNPHDWLRREIETALDEKRNIVPLFLEGFDFSYPSIVQNLTGKLTSLNKYNGLEVPSSYFFEAMEKLRNRYLNVALSDVPLRPLSQATKEVTEAQKVIANLAAPVNSSQISKQEIFEFEYSHNLAHIPIVGQIVTSEPALVPGIDFNYYDADSVVDIAISLLPNTKNINQFFALIVGDNTMSDALVINGDIIILKPISDNTKVQDGEMVVVWLPNRQESTLKHLYKEKYGYRLQPVNPMKAPIFVAKEEPLEVKGVVIMVIRVIEDSEP